MRGPHIRTIMAFTRPPIRAETKVKAPRMSAAPIDARRITSHDIETVSEREKRLQLSVGYSEPANARNRDSPLN
jgi:hypothetical protein